MKKITKSARLSIKTKINTLLGAVLFLLATDARATEFSKIHDFDGTDGVNPYAALVKGADGALYGTTFVGGMSGGGFMSSRSTRTAPASPRSTTSTTRTAPTPTPRSSRARTAASTARPASAGRRAPVHVFKINEDGTGFSKIHDFDNTNGGAEPYATLIKGADGALYGTTYAGGKPDCWAGAWSCGTVFKINEDGTGFSKIHDFDNTNGARPNAGLVKGADGALYGTTSLGGVAGDGTAFEFNEDGTGFSKLRDFGGGSHENGSSPGAALVKGADGALYGTTVIGGPCCGAGNGTVFKINEDGTGFSKIHQFDNADGRNPYAELVKGADGAFYGTTSENGPGYGIVFKINEDGTGFSRVFDFGDFTNRGAFPYAALVKGADGAFYGTTNAGGTSGYGVVFRLVVNQAPAANAGSDQTVDELSLVALDGSASADPNGEPLAYRWTQVAGPTVLLSAANSVQPTFTAPHVAVGGETLTFKLVVSDGQEFRKLDYLNVIITNVNNPPVALAGDDQTVSETGL